MAKATAVLARDVALEPSLLPGKGRAQTKEGVVMGSTVADMILRRKYEFAEKIIHFFEVGIG